MCERNARRYHSPYPPYFHAVRSYLHAALLLAAASGSFTLFAGGQDSLARARLEIRSGRTANAIRILEDYRRQHPAVSEVYNLLSIAYASEGRDDQALSMSQEFARLAPNRPEAFNNLGASFMRRGEPVEAEKAFRRALALRPDDPDTLYNLGSLLNTRHNYKEARSLLLRASGRERSPGVVFELAVAQAGLGDRKQALRTLNSIPAPSGAGALPWLRLVGTLSIDEGRWAEGTKALEQALSLAPDDQIVLYSLGLARLKSSRAKEAVALFEQSLASMPSSERHFKIGALLAQNGFDDAAVAEFDHAIEGDPQMYDAYFNLAVVHLRRRDFDRAAAAAERALNLRRTGEAYNLLGDLREEQGRYREALENLQQAVKVEPQNEDYTFDLGLELILHQNDEAAREWFRAAQARFPRSSRIALGLGTASFVAEKQDDAIEAFTKAVDLDPRYEPAYTFLGMAYLASTSPPDRTIGYLGRLAASQPRSFPAQYYYGAALVKQMDRGGSPDKVQAASVALRKASALRPDYAPAYYYLGELKRQQNRMDEAARLYEKALAVDPALVDALYKLGRTYAKMGRQEDAQRVLDRHREVTAREQQALDKRMQEVKTFILTIRTGRQ